jgi:hypothetical protein
VSYTMNPDVVPTTNRGAAQLCEALRGELAELLATTPIADAERDEEGYLIESPTCSRIGALAAQHGWPDLLQALVRGGLAGRSALRAAIEAPKPSFALHDAVLNTRRIPAAMLAELAERTPHAQLRATALVWSGQYRASAAQLAA